MEELLFTSQSSHSSLVWVSVGLIYIWQVCPVIGYALLYGMILLNSILFVLVISSRFTSGPVTASTDWIFQCFWAPVNSVLQLRHDLGIVNPDARDPGRPDPGADLTIWAKEAVGLALISFCHQKSLLWVILLPIARLLLSWSEGTLARSSVYRKPGPTGRGLDIARALQPPTTAQLPFSSQVLLVILLALYFLLRCDDIQFVTSVIYCGAVQRTGEEFISLKYGHLFEHVFDCAPLTILEGVYIVTEITVAVIYVIVGARWLCVLVLPAMYGSVYVVIVQLRQHVMHSIRRERQELDIFPRASKQELTSYDDVCAICLLRMSSINARRTPCGHLFHGRCLRLCLKEKNLCPLCSRPLSFALTKPQRLLRHHSTGSLNRAAGNLNGL